MSGELVNLLILIGVWLIVLDRYGIGQKRIARTRRTLRIWRDKLNKRNEH